MVKIPACLRKHHHKRGDTLIEVMLAIGIFSMVAVAIVAVMNAGTNSSQSALETTLASQEINVQKEAIEFIARAYTYDKQAGADNSMYGALWDKMSNSLAVNSDLSKGFDPNFHVSSCDELYDANNIEKGAAKNGFIIDAKNLSTLEAKYRQEFEDTHNAQDVIDAIIITNQNNSNSLHATLSYPRLLYQNNSNVSSDELNLIDDSASLTNQNSTLYGAEGIYIIAIRDPDSTYSVREGGPISAYVEFLIRTCWYSPGDQTPLTLSNLIRVNDPDVIYNGSSSSSP